MVESSLNVTLTQSLRVEKKERKRERKNSNKQINFVYTAKNNINDSSLGVYDSPETDD